MSRLFTAQNRNKCHFPDGEMAFLRSLTAPSNLHYSFESFLYEIPSQVALVVKNMPANAGNAGDAGLIPGLGRPLREGNSDPLEYSFLGNPMDRGVWWATVQGVAEELDTT